MYHIQIHINTIEKIARRIYTPVNGSGIIGSYMVNEKWKGGHII
jgi:hypothetical protein